MRALEWRYVGWSARRELVEGGRVLATLRWRWTRVEATIGGRVFRVRSRGWWRATIDLEEAGGAVVASMRLAGRERPVDVRGRAYRWCTPRWWRSGQVLEGPDGTVLARLRPGAMRVGVEVLGGVPEEDLVPLLVLAMHATDLWHSSGAVTAATTAGT